MRFSTRAARQSYAAGVCDWAATVGFSGTGLALLLGVDRRTLYRWRKGLSAPTTVSLTALPKKFPKKQRTRLRRVFERFALARNKFLQPKVTAGEAALILVEEWRKHAECRTLSNRTRTRVEVPISEYLMFICDIEEATPKQFRLYLCVLGNLHLKMAGRLSERSARAIGRVFKKLLRAEKKAKKAEKPATPTDYEKPFSKLQKPPK